MPRDAAPCKLRGMRVATLLAFAVLAAAACERDSEWEHAARVRAICRDLELRSAPASEADALFGPPTWTGCGTGFPPATADTCPAGDAICIRVYAFRASHEELCGGPACSYGCELRAPEADPEATCSVRFLTGSERPTAP